MKLEKIQTRQGEVCLVAQKRHKNRAKTINEIKNVVIYTRVSSADQLNNLSLDTQEEHCRKHCATKGWKVERVFVERGESAKTTFRTTMQEMLKWLQKQQGGIQAVVAYDIDRVTRMVSDWIRLQAHLKLMGISIRCALTENDASATGQFMGNMKAALKQLENDEKSERTINSMQFSARSGRRQSMAPIGYSNNIDPKLPSLAVDKERSIFVQRAFELIATGLCNRLDVFKKLTQEGLTGRTGKPISKATFYSMLTNEVYAGENLVLRTDQFVKGDWEPLVSMELFNKVQLILSGKKPSFAKYDRDNPDFPLRRFVTCASCGSPLTGGECKNGKTKKPYRKYWCQHKAKGCKNRRTIQADDLHEKFQQLLESMQIIPTTWDDLATNIREEFKKCVAETEAILRQHKRKISKSEGNLKRVQEDYLNQKLSAADYSELRQRIQKEIESEQKAAEAKRVETIDVNEVLAFVRQAVTQLGDYWRELPANEKQQFQRLVFPKGVSFDGTKYCIPEKPLIFRALEGFRGLDFQGGTPVRN